MDLLIFNYFLTKIEFIFIFFLYHFLTRCIMASLSRAEIADLKARVRKLDAQYAALCKDEELGLPVEHSKAIVLREIRVINQIISDCEKEQARQQAAARPLATPRPSMAAARPLATPRPSVSAARPLATSRPSVSAARQSMTAARPSMTAAAAARPLATPRRLATALPPDDSPLRFMDEFLREALRSMASLVAPLYISNSAFAGKYLPVRGDGNCGLRAFLTAYAARKDIGLPIDPPGMIEWIFRLKFLMIQEINNLIEIGVIALSDLLSIPENPLGAGAELNDYFALFLTDGYHITNFDFRVLASMFRLQINVIRQHTNSIDDVQCFVRHGNRIDLNITEHICIVQQPNHFVPLIQVEEHLSSRFKQCLFYAIEIGFTG